MSWRFLRRGVDLRASRSRGGGRWSGTRGGAFRYPDGRFSRVSSRWNRSEAITELQRELHWFLSSAAVHSHLPTLVDELWSLPHGFRQRLLAAHLLAHVRTRTALRDASEALRRLLPGQSAALRKLGATLPARCCGSERPCAVSQQQIRPCLSASRRAVPGIRQLQR